MNASSASPTPTFDEMRRILRELPGPDLEAQTQVVSRQGQLTKPPGSLGRLEEIAEWLAAWQGRASPRIERPRIAVFAGTHGVAARGVSAYPPAVTRQMLDNFASGGAAINQICATLGPALRKSRVRAPRGRWLARRRRAPCWSGGRRGPARD